MKPILVLITAFFLSIVTLKFVIGSWSLITAGNIAMGIMLWFTAVGHFKFTSGMAMMIPDYLPARNEAVLATGIFEIALGTGLFFHATRNPAGIATICFLLVILPINVYAAIHHVDHEKASYNGKGATYLWFRIPLQLFFIAWAWLFAIHL